MYYRKIEEILLEWKNQPDKNPLIVKGCRQCGKTSSVISFAKSHYKNVIYLDFHKNKELSSIFQGSLDVDYLIVLISAAIPTAKFEKGNTCLIFDEIQDCPQARSSLKFFKLDGRFDIICTGSLLGINGYNVTSSDASIPVGFETMVDMYPMDFEEWLWANGIQDSVIAVLREHLKTETPVPLAIHNKMRQLFLQYIVVGGMPEVVKTFLRTSDINKVLQVQKNIIEGYKSDMIKYAVPADKNKIRECFDSIPRQLSRENKKFSYSLVRKGGRSRDYIGSLQWIEDAGIIRRCYNLSITELPLIGNALQDSFKVYMADSGLFVSMLDRGTQSDILQGRLYGYKGAIYENIVADMLGKMGRDLYYFHKTDGIEIDFIIRYNGECTPLECKARTGNAKSLKTLLKHPEKYHVYNALKVGDYNVGREGNLLTLPLYMVFLLTSL